MGADTGQQIREPTLLCPTPHQKTASALLRQRSRVKADARAAHYPLYQRQRTLESGRFGDSDTIRARRYHIGRVLYYAQDGLRRIGGRIEAIQCTYHPRRSVLGTTK